jgi:multidrug resistance efflux pump
VKLSTKAAAALVGPRHTWAKLLVVGVVASALFLVFAQGTYRVEAPFVVHASEHRMVVMPYRGYITDVHVEPGDPVIAGQTVLAELDTRELRIALGRAKADLARAMKERDQARTTKRYADAQIAEAQADQVRADIELYEYQIAQARIVAPIDGVVLRGDLKRAVGTAVELGTVLFEVGPLNDIYAELLVPDSEIGEIEATGEGALAAASHPGQYIDFKVDRVSPVADVVGQRNVFRVNVRLAERPEWVRPGMEGLAKLELGKRHYAWMWTRDVVNWVRMKLWI